MTALSGSILVNNSTGNNGTSSGCGPSVAVNETITTVAATNSATVTSGAGYSVGDLMYIPSATGRKFNVIANINGTTITFDDNWDDNLTSVSAYIGGKRATLTNDLFADAHGGWNIELEYTGTDYTDNINATSGGNSTDGAVSIKGTGSQKPTWKVATGYNFISAGGFAYEIENIIFKRGNTGYAFIFMGINANLVCKNCEFDGTTYTVDNAIFWSNSWLHNAVITDCKFISINRNSTTAGVDVAQSGGQGYGQVTVSRCYFENCSHAVYIRKTYGVTITNNVIKNCSNHGVSITNQQQTRGFRVSGNIFYGGSTDGIRFIDPDDATGSFIENNIFVNNGGYAINSSTSAVPQGIIYASNNAFYGNTSGSYNGISDGINDITLTADPFVDAANGDFNLNATNGGGGTLRSTNYTLGG